MSSSNSRLSVLELERRLTPTTFTVSTMGDAGAGSLRQAIQNANSNAGPDEIQFDPTVFASAQTIALTSGELSITGPVNVTGPGAARVTVVGASNARVFNVQPGNATTVSLSGLTITGGTAAPGGGGILFQANGSTLNLTGCNVSGNKSNFSPGAGLWVNPTVAGGAANSLKVDGCTFSKNNNGGGNTPGGGLYAFKAAVVVLNSTFASNFGGTGGAIRTFDSSLLIEGSTLSGNTAPAGGGGVYFASSVNGLEMKVRNCTITDNRTYDGPGMAIHHLRSASAGKLLVQSSTITDNSVTFTLPHYGIQNQGAGTVEIESSIVTGNSDPAANGRDVWSTSTVTLNYSIVESTNGFMWSGGNNQFGVDPLLGPLTDNGGPTLTREVLPGSPAIDSGSNPANLTSDQRGANYPRTINNLTDIGAFERNPSPMVRSVVINDGAVQRSRVTSVTVVFDRVVDFVGDPTDAFAVTRMANNVSASLSSTVTNGAVTSVRLTFLAGPVVESGSLADGRYRLKVDATKVSAIAVSLDGNGDGIGGDDYVLESAPAPAAPTNIFRLFGDINGDGFTDNSDFVQYRLANGSNSTTANYNPAFDFNGDGFIDNVDFVAFRQRLGVVP